MGVLQPLHRTFRAFVRGKVESIGAHAMEIPSDVRAHLGESAAAYFRLAATYRERCAGPCVVVMCGASGTGKSHLATALGMAACAGGRKVRFFRVTELITLLLEAKEERQLLRLRQQLGKLDLLILDELGYVPASKAGAELLFDVIATAYERHSLIVTTNLPFENWTEVLGNERLTGAALDRLTHRCHILETKGESYRLQDAKRRRRAAHSA